MPAYVQRRRPSRATSGAGSRASRLSLALALIGSLAVLGLAAGAAQAIAAPLELIPAYFSPEGSPDPWHTMCEAAPAGSTVILNPDNGPVKRQAKVYAEPMKFCEEHGQKVIGYVYTKYGKRSIATVKKAIANYYRWYPAVEGIFLDEMAEVPSAKVETYYKQLTAYVHEKSGFVIGNPGDTATTPGNSAPWTRSSPSRDPQPRTRRTPLPRGCRQRGPSRLPTSSSPRPPHRRWKPTVRRRARRTPGRSTSRTYLNTQPLRSAAVLLGDRSRLLLSDVSEGAGVALSLASFHAATHTGAVRDRRLPGRWLVNS